MNIRVKQPVIIGNCYRGQPNRLWEVFILKWFLVAVACLIAAGAVTVYLAHYFMKTCYTSTNVTGVTAQHSDLNTYKGQLQDMGNGYSLFKQEDMTQICKTDGLTGSQQMRKHSTKLVCYYTFPGPGGLVPDKIDPFLCTHINIAGVGINNSKLEPLSEERQEVIKSLVGLKIRNKNLKVILSVIGMPGGFGDMVSKSSSRRMFIKDLLWTLSYYSFDGVDFDWEFPAWPGKISERKKFIIFLKELRDAVRKSQLNTIVSVAVAAQETIVDVSYDIPEMNKYIDYVNLMAYDYHFYTEYTPLTGPNAPLYSLPSDKGYMSTLNTNWSSLYWHDRGMPKNKIVIGIPTYGHSFWLINAENHGWSAPASGYGKIGSKGFVSYPEVCQFLHSTGSKYIFDKNFEVPYAYQGLEWISYDDECSVMYKAKYIASGSYGGAMVFSLNVDDHQGVCAGTTFLLTTQIRNILGVSWQ
ncbi:acidic mammalian chitinase-like isoform X1 [Schistocerca americana]|uniref:acidic mammalian chitinase-like isoform X1 n=2 Tax=Schistocerca americana TaxID=7009 RepID=UPI001F4F6D80|nr:acidic mammalian chitinase-like isoform X1 [Schistocerca americana]XP_049952879.1 acidic mammalian chitinase-like isoform X1 [Schistocerca serialis cubense]